MELVDSSPDVLVLGGQFKKDGTVVSRRKERASVVLAVGSRGDGSASGTCAGASRTADAGLKVDQRSKTRMMVL